MIRFIRTLLILSLAACTGGEQPTAPETPETPAQPEAPATDPRVEKAAILGKVVRDKPSDLEQELAAQGLTVDAYDALMYEIAADPELSAQFKKAMGE